MGRDDFHRQRLRGMYERNKRRVSALADIRDSRRSSGDDDYAPRRYVVSERSTRRLGFGRGGIQVRRVARQRSSERRDGRDGREGREGRAPIRFSDRGIFRRAARDRFIREDDFEHRERRHRFLEERQARRGGGHRFSVSRRRGLLLREREGRFRDAPEGRRGSRIGQRRGFENSRPSRDRGNNNNSRNNNNNNNNRNNNNSRNNNNDRNNRRNNNNDRSNGNGRSRTPAYSRDQLDAQLDNYRRN